MKNYTKLLKLNHGAPQLNEDDPLTPARRSLKEALEPIKRKQGRPPQTWKEVTDGLVVREGVSVT